MVDTISIDSLEEDSPSQHRDTDGAQPDWVVEDLDRIDNAGTLTSGIKGRKKLDEKAY